jgi:hypothetical protein
MTETPNYSVIPSHTLAAIRDTGYIQGGRIKKGRQRLSAWLEKVGLKTQEDFTVAGYMTSGYTILHKQCFLALRTRENMEAGVILTYLTMWNKNKSMAM